MHLKTILPSFVLATAPALVAADRGRLGFSIGVNNADGSCKATPDYEADFDALKPISTLVRTYSSSNCDVAKNIIPAAQNKGFKVVLGVWYVCEGRLLALVYMPYVVVLY